MYKRERSQLSFHDMIYDRVIRKSHFLYKLESVIDWHRFERYFDRLYPSSAGRPHTEGGSLHTIRL
ncbi:hypothetical protein IIB79_05580 [candidate division KSB1 bacterium]|nr:hypothetical protein [candidate division KSB1 bacterium]